MKLLTLVINGNEIQSPSGIPDPSKVTLSSLISGVLNLMVVAGIVIALFFIIYGGWLWINSKGDKEKLEKARMTIVYTFVGLVIVALSLVFVNIIKNLLGINQ